MPGVLLWGYDTANKVWIPLQVDSSGRLKVDLSNIDLNDLGDVSVAAPADGDFLYYDDATGLWLCKAHADLTTGVHGVGAYGIIAATTSSVTRYVDAGSGDDDNPGTSASPKATIQGALDALPLIIAHPVYICVRPGNYAESNVEIDVGRFDTLDYIYLKVVNDNDEDMYDNGLATGGGNTWLDDAGAAWSADQFNGAYIWIYEGTGAGQVRTISDTTATKITVSVAWATNPDATSYYAIGGGATLTGTDSYHINPSGKKLEINGFRHTGATSVDIRIESAATVGVNNNYHASSNHGVVFDTALFKTSLYNYNAASGDGIQGNYCIVSYRASVFSGCTRGAYGYFGTIFSMQIGAGVKNYFLNCTTGIYLHATAAGCNNATGQVFSGCVANYFPAVSSAIPQWYT